MDKTHPACIRSSALPPVLWYLPTLAAGLCLHGAARGSEIPAAARPAGLATSTQATAPRPRRPATRLDTIEVSATAVGYHASRVDSGKYATPVADVPQCILMLPHALLQDQNVHSLRDMLSNNVAGITFAAGEGGGGLGDNLSMRGFQSRNNIYVDGIRDATQMIRSDDFNLDHIEVIRGSDSSYSGAGAVAGVINMSSKRPALTNFNHVSLGGGTAVNRRATIDINRILSHKYGIAARMNAMGNFNNIAGRDTVFNHRWGFAPSITFGLGTPTRVNLSYLYEKDHNLPDFGILRDPRNDVKVRALPGSRWNGYYGLRNFDRDDARINTVTLKIDHDFSSQLQLRNISRFSDVNRRTGATATTPRLMDLDLAAGTYDGGFGPSAFRRAYSTQQVENQTDLIWSHGDKAGPHNTLDIGLDFSRLKYAGAQFSNIIPASELGQLSISHPAGRYDGPVMASYPIRNTRSQQVDKGIYLIDTLVIDSHWQLTGAARYDSWDLQYEDLVAGNRQTRTDGLFSWKLGATWKPTRAGAVYLSYSTAVLRRHRLLRLAGARPAEPGTRNR